jgi:hypothetical protein
LRRFVLERYADVSGVSGNGIVAEGTEWTDKTATIRWYGERPSTVVWESVDDAMRIHGHDGLTIRVWLDPPTEDQIPKDGDPHSLLYNPGYGTGWVPRRCSCLIGRDHLARERPHADPPE